MYTKTPDRRAKPEGRRGGPNSGGTWMTRLVTAALVFGGGATAAAALSACGGGSSTATGSTTTTAAGSSITAPSTTTGGTGNGRRGFPGGGATAGTITAINGSTLTVRTAAGKTVTVDTSSSTKVTTAAAATAANVTNGATVRATGTVTNGELDAFQVEIGPLSVLNQGFGGRAGGARGSIPGAPSSSAPSGSAPSGSTPSGSVPSGAANFRPITGTVSNVQNGSFILTESTGTAGRVTTSSTTSYVVVAAGTVSELQVGQTVVVVGPTSASGTVTATAVTEGRVGGFGAFGGRRPGAATSTSTTG